MDNTVSRKQNSVDTTKSLAFDVLWNDHIFKCKLDTIDILDSKHGIYILSYTCVLLYIHCVSISLSNSRVFY